MRLGITEHRVRLGAEEYRVLRTAGLRRARCYDAGRWVEVWVDRAAAAELAAAWLLAARSPRSLVHLPLRGRGERPRIGRPLPEPHQARDLLLVHHSRQFPTSRWKEVRGRLGHGSPRTVEFRAADFPSGADRAGPESLHAGFHDRLRLTIAAGTLVLTGSALAFADVAADFLDLADTGPAEHRRRQGNGGHACVELRPSSGLLDRSMPAMHVEYCPDWEPVPATAGPATAGPATA
ncbi:hypothetical protein [Streptomyces sp. S.PB5]|uniref:hypothetical protein n=1 Tax=Streptomyces sp. S.PB5 TaxID=3020844 RepID=UPI0025B26328|nr:hypothetical protein [Streptomyces sp. S.PB5]MDN3022573.1 hypothetical protein [Streptomyces sp. S.PB5]